MKKLQEGREAFSGIEALVGPEGRGDVNQVSTSQDITWKREQHEQRPQWGKWSMPLELRQQAGSE